MRSSGTSTACRCGITTSCWRVSSASAPSAGSNPPAGCVSITAMSPARCAGCSAAHAISPSASSRTARPGCARRPPMSRLRSTHRLTVSTRIARGLDPLLRRESAGGAPPRYAPSSSTPSSSTRCRRLAISCLLWVRCLSSTSRMRAKPRFLSASTSIPPDLIPPALIPPALGSMPAASQTMSISRSRACNRPRR